MALQTRTQNRIKREWDSIQGRSNVVDFERAKLLNDTWHRLQQSDVNLAKFIVGVLEEFPGKRTSGFVRMAQAFEVIDDKDIWAKLGARSTVLLSRITGKRKRNAIMKRVDKTLDRTGRETVSEQTFRTIAKKYLGLGYKVICCEGRSGSGALRAELEALKGFALDMLRRDPSVKRLMSKTVKRALGLTNARTRAA